MELSLESGAFSGAIAQISMFFSELKINDVIVIVNCCKFGTLSPFLQKHASFFQDPAENIFPSYDHGQQLFFIRKSQHHFNLIISVRALFPSKALAVRASTYHFGGIWTVQSITQALLKSGHTQCL